MTTLDVETARQVHRAAHLAYAEATILREPTRAEYEAALHDVREAEKVLVQAEARLRPTWTA